MTELFTLAEAAARLVTLIGDPSAAIDEAFRDGYALGYGAGLEVGRMRLDHELVEQDRRRAEYIRGIANSAPYAVIEARRWDSKREDFGKPRAGDHPGGPVDWETSRPRVLQGVA